MNRRDSLIQSLLILMLLISGCSTELVINSPADSFPVVYGVIDPWSDNYFIYVAKSALPETDVYEVAQQPGYFRPDSVEVRMELWNDSIMLWYSYFHEIKTEKEPGVFSNGSGWAMESDRVIPKTSDSATIHIIYPDFRNLRFFITSPEFSKPAYARIEYVEPIKILRPYLTDHNVSLYSHSPFIINWALNERYKYFDVHFKVHYSEISDTIRYSSVSFCYAMDIGTNSDYYEVRVEPDKFLRLFAEGLSHDTLPCSYRKVHGFDLIVMGGDVNFADYLVQARFGSPVYQKPFTNIVNGLGILALKGESKKVGMTFAQESMDSLALGQYTKQFGFVRW